MDIIGKASGGVTLCECMHLSFKKKRERQIPKMQSTHQQASPKPVQEVSVWNFQREISKSLTKRKSSNTTGRSSMFKVKLSQCLHEHRPECCTEQALRPPPTFESFSSFSQSDFLSGGYPNLSSGIHKLRFGSQHLIPKPPLLMPFWVDTAFLFFFFFSGGHFFPEAPVTKIRVSTPVPHKNPTVNEEALGDTKPSHSGAADP